MHHMTSTNIKVTTTFDFAKMAGIHNNYDQSLVHPHNHVLRFLGRDGVDAELSVAQLATIAALVNALGSPGQTIDKLFAILKQQFVEGGFTQSAIDAQISAICGRY